MDGRAVLDLQNITHRYGTLRAVDGLSLSVGAGEVVCLLGPSGCGKSTVLRLAAGLERLQAGAVAVGGRVMADAAAGIDVPPEARGVGLVFQDYALFPHLDVLGNVAFGLGGPAAARMARARAVLEQLGVHWVVEGLNLKPGRPTRIGRAPRGGWVLGLPGNPVSCAVCFLLFGRFILEGLMGLPPKPPPRLSGKLDERMPANGARPMFQPAEWRAGADGEVRVRPIPWRGSGDPFGLAAANALIYRPAEVRAADTGHSVAFVPLACPR